MKQRLSLCFVLAVATLLVVGVRAGAQSGIPTGLRATASKAEANAGAELEVVLRCRRHILNRGCK